jgi:ATP-dependent Clp protease protease subunit
MNEYQLDTCKDKDDDKEKGSMQEKLLKARKIVISSEVDSKLANKVTNQLLLLENEDPNKQITIFINSPGGEIFSGFAIFDMMKFIKPLIKTVVMGFAASMGAILSLGAEPGYRYALPNSMFLIHQPLISGVYRGSAADIEIQAREMINTKNRIINIYVEATGKTHEEIKNDIDRDFWLTAKQALEYGPKALIDKMLVSSDELNNI